MVKRFIPNILVAAGLAAAMSSAAMAQNNQPAPDSIRETFGAWTVYCKGNQTQCFADQALYTKKKQMVARVTIMHRNAGKGDPVLRTLTPLGTNLRTGAILQIDDGKPDRMPFLTCLRRGCYTETKLTAGLVKALRTGKKLSVTVQARTGKGIKMVMKLDGVAGALDRVGVK